MASRQKTIKREPFPAFFQIRNVHRKSSVSPSGQCRQPTSTTIAIEPLLVPMAGVVVQLPLHPIEHGLRAFGPTLSQLIQGLRARRNRLCQQLRERLCGIGVGCGLGQQIAHVGHQRIHIAPHGQHLREGRFGQGIAALAPVVVRGFGAQRNFVGHQGFVKQTAAVKSVLTQHALAPGVNREDGGFVHALRRDVQEPCRVRACLARRIVSQQRREERVVVFFGVTAETTCRLQQARADTVGQFPRGRPGKGHHQNFRGSQCAGERVCTAMAQHQAQVERGNRPGFAGAGAGFDQAAAPQVQLCGLQGLAIAHSPSPSLASMATCGCSVALTWSRCQSNSGW